MDPKIIVIDGKTYHSTDEMPAEIRQRYELAMRLMGDVEADPISGEVDSRNILADRNRNGVPDMLENIVAANAVVDGMKIIIDGREFNSIEDLSPQERARYDEAMRKLDKNRNGIPDFVEDMLKRTNRTANLSTSFETESAPYSPATHQLPIQTVNPSGQVSSAQHPPFDPTITPDTTNGWALALAGLFLLLVCAAGAAGVWYFFLR